jgi:hypothetical protein
MNSRVNIKITRLEAEVVEPISLRWRGKEIDAGPITVGLEESPSQTANQGVLDYGRSRARVEFHVCLSFPELASPLESLGVDEGLTRPLSAVIRSEGEILDDHSLMLSGECDIGPHALFPAEETRASVLPGV